MTDPIIPALAAAATALAQSIASDPLAAAGGGAGGAAVIALVMLGREWLRNRREARTSAAQEAASEAEAEAARLTAEPSLVESARGLIVEMRTELRRVREDMAEALDASERRCQEQRDRDREECREETRRAVEQVREEMRTIGRYAADTRERLTGPDDTGVHELRRKSDPVLRAELDTEPETPAALARVRVREEPPPPSRKDRRRE